MAERRTARVRVLFLALLIANVLVFVYWQFRSDSQRNAAARIEELQINPGRIRLLGAATRGGGHAGAQPAPAAKAAAVRACVEWGPLSPEEAVRAESALRQLALRDPPIRRPLADAAGGRVSFFIREPESQTVERLAELQREFAGTEIKAGPCPADKP